MVTDTKPKATFRPNALAWMRVKMAGFPVHRVMSQPGEPVRTRCHWQPTGGERLFADEAINVSRHWCTGCWRAS